ncbi:MAG: ATP-binding cassette domain-containing protein, partial [Bacteroidetes bacterium]|nr:ATP-binding cassette domain-containing protein [Bacteroidota bacterium]
MIQLRKISKSFRHLSVLNDLNLSFEDAGISAILGPNGSGKTTMIKCLLGMVLPNHGDILINEQNISRQW